MASASSSNNRNINDNQCRSSSADSALFDGLEVEDSPDDLEDDEDYESLDHGREDLIGEDFQSIENKISKSNRRVRARIVNYGSKRQSLVQFSPQVVYQRSIEAEQIGEKFNLTFKFIKNETKLIRNILEGHGFREVHPSSSEFNILWTGGGMKPFTLRSLHSFQRVNHFPRSYEMTRKDRLYKNVQKMQQEKGLKNFNFIPTTFLLPYEFEDFSAAFQREKGLWIIKPVASSQGKGIFLINHPDQVPLDENLVISRYIDNPLLIDGYKFDVRIYVAVTSYDPLVAYLYKEGLTRFATVKYDPNSRTIKNAFMHLTNYSVNKRSHRYVRCDDPDIEDFGNKWSMSAMLRLLKSEGKDTFTLMMSIEDVIIKTLLTVESQISAACRMFVPTRGNCFEVYGFDILIDDELKPWVLEVNLSPSLACDAPLDLKIKSSMICDLLNLCSFPCIDPSSNNQRQKQQKQDIHINGSEQIKKRRPISAGYSLSTNSITNVNRVRTATQSRSTSKTRQSNNEPTIKTNNQTNCSNIYFGLSPEESRILRTIKEENRQKGGFIRIFPTSDTFEFFSSFFEQRTTSFNQMIHQRLYPSKWQQNSLGTNQINPGQGTSIRRTTIPRFKHLSSLFNSIQSNDKIRFVFNKKPLNIDLYQALQRSEIYHQRLEDPHQDEQQTKQKSIDDRQKSSNSIKYSKQENSSSIHRQEKKAKEKLSSNDEQRHSIYDKNQFDEQLNQGFTLSPYQARLAFGTYLQRIQIRLMLDSELKEEVTSSQHMDLVLRFLKRAGQNLTPLFRVEIPSRRLSMSDQKRILAKQLSDFLHFYQKETSNNCLSSGNSVDQTLFDNYLRSASESDLEQLMTNYMKTNPNSSIHLGVHPKTIKQSSSSVSINSTSTISNKKIEPNEINQGDQSLTNVNYLNTAIQLNQTEQNHRSTTRTSSASRQRSATNKKQDEIYRLYGISRPLSAVVQNRKQLPSTSSSVGSTTKSFIKQRPNSANLPGDQQETNQEFVEQLNELSSKQHRRQYSGVHHLNVTQDQNLSSSIDGNQSSSKNKKLQSREEEILEKSRQILEESQTKNEQLAEQAKIFQRTLQRNEIYSALNRSSHRPPIYPTSLFKENKSLSGRFQSLRNQTNLSLFTDQHRFKSSSSSHNEDEQEKCPTDEK